MDHHDTKNFELLDSLIKQGKIKTGTDNVFVDVGACRGLYTWFLGMQLRGSGKIYSIEMHPEIYQSLHDNLGHVTNVEVINAAITDCNETVEYYEGSDEETHGLIMLHTSKNKVAGKIQGITLDTLLKDEKQISVIKIDVEGAELKVLHGMKDTIKKSDVILLENHNDEDWEEIRHILIKDNEFFCYNIEKTEQITENSHRAYQCICLRSPLFWNKEVDLYPTSNTVFG